MEVDLFLYQSSRVSLHILSPLFEMHLLLDSNFTKKWSLIGNIFVELRLITESFQKFIRIETAPCTYFVIKLDFVYHPSHGRTRVSTSPNTCRGFSTPDSNCLVTAILKSENVLH